MATNTQSTRTTTRPSDQGTTVETANTPIVTSTGVGGVAVYDHDAERTDNPSLHRSTTLTEDRAPVETRSGGSMISWIIGAIVLIALVYFLLQMVF